MSAPVSGEVQVSFVSGPELLGRREVVAQIQSAAFGTGELAAARYAATSLPEMIALPGYMAAIAQTAEGNWVGFNCGHDAVSHRPWFDRVGGALGHAGERAWLDDPFELAEVVVDPAWQGRGVGTQLCLAMQGHLGSRPALLVTYHGDHPAKRFYRRLGWRVLVEDFEYIAGRPPTSILGFRRIEPARLLRDEGR